MGHLRRAHDVTAATKGLAAAVIKLAVEDLDVAHRKVRIWDEKYRKGTLKDYVQKNTGEQNDTPITLTIEDQSAIKFLTQPTKHISCISRCLILSTSQGRCKSRLIISARTEIDLKRLYGDIGYRRRARKTMKNWRRKNSGKNNACNGKNDGL